MDYPKEINDELKKVGWSSKVQAQFETLIDPAILHVLEIRSLEQNEERNADEERMAEWSYFIREYRKRLEDIGRGGMTKTVACVVLHEIGNYTLNQVAEAMGMTWQGVWWHISKARGKGWTSKKPSKISEGQGENINGR